MHFLAAAVGLQFPLSIMHSKFPSHQEESFDMPTKGTMIHFRDQAASEAAQHYRREEMLKKKIKAVVEMNAGMEKDIKTQEEEIRDERAGVVFQLSELIKETALKYGYFVERRLEGRDYSTNQDAHVAMQEMMAAYQKIERECRMLSKIYDTLAGINSSYEQHSKHIEQTVVSVEQQHQEYERNVEQRLSSINADIQASEEANEQTEKRTEQLVKQIDDMVEGAEKLKEEEANCVLKIERLKRKALRQQERVDEMAEWTDIVVDRSNRKLVFNTMREKKDYLHTLSKKNQLLEMRLAQLEQEQQCLTREKQRQKQNENPKPVPVVTKRAANRRK